MGREQWGRKGATIKRAIYSPYRHYSSLRDVYVRGLGAQYFRDIEGGGKRGDAASFYAARRQTLTHLAIRGLDLSTCRRKFNAHEYLSRASRNNLFVFFLSLPSSPRPPPLFHPSPAHVQKLGQALFITNTNFIANKI